MEALIVAIVVPIVTSLVTYLGVRHQSKTELKKLQHSQMNELNKLKEIQIAEIEKIKEQHIREIEKINLQLDKQAELYEKNKKTDMAGKLMEKLIEGDTTGIEALVNLKNQVESGKFQFSNRQSRRK